ncbi:MAG TPA: acyl-CoA thioesterase [Xanthomonadaceae bacterium]|nr:acyl-CoA thioesterase [Xanthomonadaceae bacterium]
MPGIRRDLTLRFLAEPTDVNFGGKVFGGAVMKWIDLAGYACATGWSGRYCVTAYVGGIQFERPISIGQLIEVRAQLILTGTTSMHIWVEVHSRDVRADDWGRTTQCLMVFVATGDDGRPVAVPAFEPESDEQRRLADYARHMKSLSLQLEHERQRWLPPDLSGT